MKKLILQIPKRSRKCLITVQTCISKTKIIPIYKTSWADRLPQKIVVGLPFFGNPLWWPRSHTSGTAVSQEKSCSESLQFVAASDSSTMASAQVSRCPGAVYMSWSLFPAGSTCLSMSKHVSTCDFSSLLEKGQKMMKWLSQRYFQSVRLHP